MRITWIKPEELVLHELKQAEEEGKEVAAYRRRWEEAAASGADLTALRELAREIMDEVEALPSPTDPLEPSELSAIEALCPGGGDAGTLPRFSRDELLDRLKGAWLGRAAGCLLGKPVEKVPREGIRAILEATGRWPLDRYFTAVGLPPEVEARYPWNRKSRLNSLEENIVCMPEDDDLNYPMLNLHVLEEHGRDFTTENIAQAWLQMLPVLTVFTAERIAYMNLLLLKEPPETAMYRNPYREWIGAQIRGDIFGWINPGRPREAAAMAWRDARLSHVKNGIYGEMFVAATLAGAFVARDVREAVEMGLAQIPPGSRLAEAIRFALSLPEREATWEGAVDRIYERYGHYHWVHTINNAALLVAALIYGEGDYERTICNAVMGGWDTDCNGATVGSVIGVMLGASKLPAKWIAPLNNRVR
ncbi:MAG TPA: ADP-ribosylglycohydrolase family protein, partial [Symbiobacteriaceae bacterium]